MLPKASAHLVVDDLDRPEINKDDRHHLFRVLRLKELELVTVTNGRGLWRTCKLANDALVVDGRIRKEARAEPRISVGFALTKASKPELVVQKLTELGVDRVMPVTSRRSVLRWDADKAAQNVSRWRRVATEAVMQSRSTWLPEISEVTSIESAIHSADRPIAMAHPGGEPLSLARPTVFVGPEGGWSDEELAAGVPLVGLSNQILRAETAAFAAGLYLTGLRAGFIKESPRLSTPLG